MGLLQYIYSIQPYDVIATMILGVFAISGREIWHHYQNGVKTTPRRFFLMWIVGIVCGLFGGEVASISNHNDWSWILTLVFGWLGGDSLTTISDVIFGMINKGLSMMNIEPSNTKACPPEEVHPIEPATDSVSAMLQQAI